MGWPTIQTGHPPIWGIAVTREPRRQDAMADMSDLNAAVVNQRSHKRQKKTP